MKKLISTFHFPLSTFHFPLSTFHFPLVLLLLVMTFGSSIHAQCLVEGSNIIYTPNPSNTVVNNGTEWVKLYIHVMERFPTDPTLSDQEVSDMVAEANADFSGAGIQFFYCLDRTYNPEFVSSDNIWLTEIYNSCNKDDGIDVYLLPKEFYVAAGFITLDGGGYAFRFINGIADFSSAIPGEEIVCWGKSTLCEFPFHTPDVRSCQIPHLLSHELGHCLGLFHTHHEGATGPTPPDNSNCDITGDLICDTNPAKNAGWCVTQNCEEVEHYFSTDCTFNAGYHTPVPGYTPNLDNIMANANLEFCSNMFTPGQNNRLLATLQNNLLLQKFRYKVYDSDVTITSNETWPLPSFPPSGNVVIKGNLIIDSGASLTVSMGQISFSEMSIAAIRPRGLLTIGNATLTADCNTWQGVGVGVLQFTERIFVQH